MKAEWTYPFKYSLGVVKSLGRTVILHQVMKQIQYMILMIQRREQIPPSSMRSAIA